MSDEVKFNRAVTKQEFWELMAYAYRRMAHEAHMKKFAPMKGAFWSKSLKERYKIIDWYAAEIVKGWIDGGIFCDCGHLDLNHMWPDTPQAQCIGNRNMCGCKKFKSEVMGVVKNMYPIQKEKQNHEQTKEVD